MTNVDVAEASVRDHGIQFIGNTTIGTFHQRVPEDGKAQRRWKDVTSWLSPPDEALKLQSFIENESRTNRKLDKAGSWFIANEHFRNWINGRSKRIWVNGAMGCGKTVLFLRAIEEVRKICLSDNHKRLAYFYCTSRNPLGQDLTTLFKSLLRQFCTRDSIPIAIETLYDSCDRGIDRRTPSTRELASCLKEVVSESSKGGDKNAIVTGFYILIDGLDELAVPTMDELLDELKPIVSSQPRNLHILLASRNHREIELSIDDAATWNKLPLDTARVQEDIEQFVLSEIAATALLRRLPHDLKADIVERVAKQSCGMFRWAFLQMQLLKALKPPVRAPKVRQRLISLPATLDETYDEMLHSLDECDLPLARRALRWLVFSSRPLFLEELIEAIAIDLEATQMISERLDPLGVEALLKDFIQIHPPLFQNHEQIAQRAHRVVLAHASIQEYLLKVVDSFSTRGFFSFDSTGSNIIMAQSCLAYLLSFNTYDLRHHRQEYPFLRYAWYHWEQHFPGQDSQYVRTMSTAELRRKAPTLLLLIKRHIEETLCRSEMQTGHESNDSQDSIILEAIFNGVRRAAEKYHLVLDALPEALNVPYFHPAYDDFCSRESVKESFSYKPLIDDTTWIRLVEILPAIDPATPVSCRLVTCKLDDAPPYAALSYAWGSNERSHSVVLEGQNLQVGLSQLTVLQSMRSRVEDENPAVWIDFLCVNQGNFTEITAQIPLIPKIVRKAREVIVHMDKETKEDSVHLLARLAAAAASGTAIDQDQDQHVSARRAITVMASSGELLGLLSLFKNAWWMKSWALQEIVCATKGVVSVENLSFNFDIVGQIMKAEKFIAIVLETSAPAVLRALENNQGWQIARQIAHTRTEYQQGMRIELPTLMWRFRNTFTSDPKDKVYSLLSFCVSESHHKILVDHSYHYSPNKMALEISHWFLMTYRSLDFLDVRSAYKPSEKDIGICSWVLPFWALRAQRLPLDPGVFCSADQIHIYAATGAKSYPVLVLAETLDILRIRGLVFDQIGVQHEPDWYRSDYATSTQAWFSDATRAQAAISEAGSPHKTMDFRWRTVTANQWPLGKALTTSTVRGTRIPPRNEDGRAGSSAND